MLVPVFRHESLARAAGLQNLEPSKLLQLCMVQGRIPCDWPQWLDHFVLGFFLAGAEDVASSSSSFLKVTGELALILAVFWRQGMVHGPCFKVAHCMLVAVASTAALHQKNGTMVPSSWNWRRFQLAEGLNGQLGRLALACLHLADWSQWHKLELLDGDGLLGKEALGIRGHGQHFQILLAVGLITLMESRDDLGLLEVPLTKAMAGRKSFGHNVR